MTAAKYTCTNCGLEETLEPALIDGREPDGIELDAQMRAEKRWKINRYQSGPNRATCCSKRCAEAWMAERNHRLSPPTPTPAPPRAEQKLLFKHATNRV